jgi:5-methylcytosine-specific restriction endonuclease McrA
LFECTQCKKMKPRGQFRKRNDGKIGITSWCRECLIPAHRAGVHRRHERSKGHSFTVARVRQLLTLQKGRCAICGKPMDLTGYHIDHIIPLARGGLNNDANIQLTHPKCNLRKGSKILTFFNGDSNGHDSH